VSSGQSFTPLGDVAGGNFSSFAYGISADGLVVVGQGTSASGPEAFRWTQAGGMIRLGELAGGLYGSTARAASGDGSVIVGDSWSASGHEAFRWTSPGPVVPMGDLTGGTFDSSAHAVSDDGTRIAGGGDSALGNEAWVWQGGGLIPLGDLPGGSFESRAQGISGDGNVVLGTGDSGVLEPFRYELGMSMQGLGNLPPGPDWGVAKAASFDGKVVVGWDEHSVVGDAEAFRWISGVGLIGMGYLPGATPLHSVANDTNMDGTIIVGASGTASGALRAFIWDPINGMRDLQTLLVALGVEFGGFQLRGATGISADGTRITGFGLNKNGDLEAWYVVLPDPTIPTPPVPALPIWGATLLATLLWGVARASGRRG
jgi:probable HAF family extracellular repeat protein